MYALLAALGLLLALPVVAGEADVLDVAARKDGDGGYGFDVTVRHADIDRSHYADKWEIVSPDGKTVFATRPLLHPHENEQPFTRSLSGVRVPAGVGRVTVRAHDSVHGFGGQTKRVTLPR